MSRRAAASGPAEPPAGLRSTTLTIGDRTVVVFSYPVEERPGAVAPPRRRSDDAAALTAAEREIARAVIDGMTSAEIARSRSRSIATVNKQIESVYRKLGVHSRAELCARSASLFGRSAEPDANNC